MRLPKLPGFKSFKKKAVVISLDQISANFKDGEMVSLEALEAKGLIKKGEKAKILNNGKLTPKVSLGEGVKASEKVVGLFGTSPHAAKEEKSLEKTDKTPTDKKDETPVAKKAAVKKPVK